MPSRSGIADLKGWLSTDGQVRARSNPVAPCLSGKSACFDLAKFGRVGLSSTIERRQADENEKVRECNG